MDPRCARPVSFLCPALLAIVAGCTHPAPAGDGPGPASSASLLPAERRPQGRGRSVVVSLPKTDDTGTFARYTLDERREAIVRRGAEAGFNYGTEQSRRAVSIGGVSYQVVRYAYRVMAPPPPRGAPPVDPAQLAVDVLFIEGIAISVPAEAGLMERVIAAVRVE